MVKEDDRMGRSPQAEAAAGATVVRPLTEISSSCTSAFSKKEKSAQKEEAQLMAKPADDASHAALAKKYMGSLLFDFDELPLTTYRVVDIQWDVKGVSKALQKVGGGVLGANRR